jgi:hypothetical protein
LVLIALADPALADTDWKTYAGTACQAGHRRELIDYDAFGGICNTSPDQNIVVHCPLVRDFSQSRFPLLVRHAATAATCTLRSMRREGPVGAIEHREVRLTGILFNTFFAAVNWVESDVSSMTTESWGALVLTCDLPPSFRQPNGNRIEACLYNYSVQEWDGN